MLKKTVDDLVDAASKVFMFDLPWDDESLPEVKSNRDAVRKAFMEVLRRYRIQVGQ